jgi:uncharacterized protein (TIGR02145 family)
MKHILYLTLAAALLFAGCAEDDPAPELSVDPITIAATDGAGNYPVAVTSNVEWSATSAADWLTLTPAAGTGNGTIIVNVAKNTVTEERTATFTVTAGALSQTITVTQEAMPLVAPPNAASARMWKIGDYVWSDVIHLPECNKSAFEDSFTEPQCRSYNHQNAMLYYYNLTYTLQNAEHLCPSPWRMPTKEDFMALDIALGGDGENRFNSADIINAGYMNTWGASYGGYSNATDGVPPMSMNMNFYWSSTLDGDRAYVLCFAVLLGGGALYPQGGPESGHFGMQVRCIK